MATSVKIDDVIHLAPNIRSSYRQAFQNGQAWLDQAQITQSALRIAHFMAQVLHESSGLTKQFENLNYSPDRLAKIWPSRFQPAGPLDPIGYAHNPQKLANEVYGGRMGNSGSDDGFTYRGRGLLQITGRDSYREATQIVRQYFPAAPDFAEQPDDVISPDWCLAIATSEWNIKNCNELADQDNIRRVTRAINGGLIGLAERMEWLKKTKAVWQ